MGQRNVWFALHLQWAAVVGFPRKADGSLTTRPVAGVNVRRMKTPPSIGVIGAGTMGAGIAQACVIAGLPVVMIDVNDQRIARARAVITERIQRTLAKAARPASEYCATLDRLRGTTDYAALSDCDFVIEAATENESLKVSLLRRIDAVARGDAIVATNTSSISIASLAANMDRPQAFVGLHFFNPVPVMHLVEVVRGPQSDDATVEAAAALAKQLGKTPVIVKDAPGFVVNRLLCPMLNEAVLACSQGVATPSDIDQAMNLGCNHPIGPLALCDLIGLDVVLAVMQVFQHDFNDPKYRPAPLLEEMVAAGHLGRKAGRGFYTYEGATAT
jgi:3-hydroxybutyryl-CoA dehydrogenase